jgi:hypothetical protein
VIGHQRRGIGEEWVDRGGQVVEATPGAAEGAPLVAATYRRGLQAAVGRHGASPCAGMARLLQTAAGGRSQQKPPAFEIGGRDLRRPRHRPSRQFCRDAQLVRAARRQGFEVEALADFGEGADARDAGRFPGPQLHDLGAANVRFDPLAHGGPPAGAHPFAAVGRPDWAKAESREAVVILVERGLREAARLGPRGAAGLAARSVHLEQMGSPNAVTTVVVLDPAQYRGLEAPVLAHGGVDVLDVGGVFLLEPDFRQSPAFAMGQQQDGPARVADHEPVENPSHDESIAGLELATAAAGAILDQADRRLRHGAKALDHLMKP